MGEFFTHVGDDNEVFGEQFITWTNRLLRRCDYEQMLYTSCREPNASIDDLYTYVQTTLFTSIFLGYVTGFPIFAALTSTPLVTFVFLDRRYDYAPRCLPSLPVCLARDVHLLWDRTFGVSECFCQTRVGAALLDREDSVNLQRCQACDYWRRPSVYRDRAEPMKYNSCPVSSVPRPFHHFLLVTKIWAGPVFKVMFNSFYSPLRVFTDMSSEIQHMVATAGTASEIEHACAILNIPDFFLVLMASSLAVGILLQLVATITKLLFGTFALYYTLGSAVFHGSS